MKRILHRSLEEVPHHILEEMVRKFSQNVKRTLADLEESTRVTHEDLEFWFGPKETRPPSNRRVSIFYCKNTKILYSVS